MNPILKAVYKCDAVYQRCYEHIRAIGRRVGARQSARRDVHGRKLTKNQIQQIKDLYAPYTPVSTIFHEFYYAKTGEFSPEYLPDDIWFNRIDRYYNNPKMAHIMENKCYFARMFPTAKQPEVVAYRMNGFWLSDDLHQLREEELLERAKLENELVVKQAVGSAGGHAVFFVSKDSKDEKDYCTRFLDITNSIERDIIVQRPIRQHEGMNILNSSSVNTIRLVTMLSQDGVKLYLAMLRMGLNGARVDNAGSGGIACGIDESGRLKRYAYSYAGAKLETHPSSGQTFEGFEIPSFTKACQLVYSLHPMVPDFRIVSWDVAIGEDGEPILIEANLNSGGVSLQQITTGPLFGSDTKKILEEVFFK